MMVMPPPESREDTETVHNGATVNFLNQERVGGREAEAMKLLEKESENSMFIFLSDVHLDDLEVLKRVEEMLQGFEGFPPDVICT